MAVRSEDAKNPVAERTQAHKAARTDWAVLFGNVGMWLAIVSFGGVFWAVNGGYSVRGLGVLASSFNEAGMLFWQAMTAITFPVPVAVPGLPRTQPLIPWIGVVAASLLQICTLVLRINNKNVPMKLILATLLLSLYDLGTTFTGLGTVPWIAQVGWAAQAILAVILTFSFEAAIGFMLRRK